MSHNTGVKREPVSNYEALAFLIMTLRKTSSRQKPLTVSQIRDLCELSVSEKKIRASLRNYMELQNSYKSDMFRYHNRGTMRTVGREKRIRYYWESLLSEPEQKMYESVLRQINERGVKENGN